MEFLRYFSEQLVWRDQVASVSDVVGAGLRTIATDQGQGPAPRVLALVMTLSLINMAVTIIHNMQQICHNRGCVGLAGCGCGR